jgi:hypothetical protein
MYRRYRLCRPTDCDLPSKSSWTEAVELPERNMSSRSDPAAQALRSFEVDKEPAEDVKVTKLSYLRQRCSGWRVGVAASCGLMFLVLLINIIFLAWATRTYTAQARIGTIPVGSCQRTKDLNTWLHLAINVLGTAMLGGSNYCTTNDPFMSRVGEADDEAGMQYLCAPTRAEVDRAHAVKAWTDIGIMSLRNLRVISTYRVTIWILLALSSVPLHLL